VPTLIIFGKTVLVPRLQGAGLNTDVNTLWGQESEIWLRVLLPVLLLDLYLQYPEQTFKQTKINLTVKA